MLYLFVVISSFLVDPCVVLIHIIQGYFNDTTLQWRDNEYGGFSNHQSHNCLLIHLFRRISKKTLKKLDVTGLCEGNSPVTGEFPTQRASHVENVSISWLHHEEDHSIAPVVNEVIMKDIGKLIYYNDIIMSVIASQIMDVSMVCSRVCSGTNQRKHQSSMSLAFVRGIHQWLVNSPHKGLIMRKMIPFDDIIMRNHNTTTTKCEWYACLLRCMVHVGTWWRGALMFPLISIWINHWVNNCEAGDLRCHRGHYDVTVMSYGIFHAKLSALISPQGLGIFLEINNTSADWDQ